MRCKRSSASVACDPGRRGPSDVCGHQRGDCKRGCRSSSFQARPAHFRLSPAGSSGRCNTSIKSFGWGCKSQSLAWSFVELPSHFVELGLRVHGQVSPLRQVLPKQTVGVFIGTTLPRTLRIAEVNVDVGRQRQAPMVRKLLAAVPGQRLIQLIRYRLRLLDQRGNYGLGILVGDLVSVT